MYLKEGIISISNSPARIMSSSFCVLVCSSVLHLSPNHQASSVSASTMMEERCVANVAFRKSPRPPMMFIFFKNQPTDAGTFSLNKAIVAFSTELTWTRCCFPSWFQLILCTAIVHVCSFHLHLLCRQSIRHFSFSVHCVLTILRLLSRWSFKNTILPVTNESPRSDCPS